MRKAKQLLAAVLTVAMLSMFLPVGVFAAEEDENANSSPAPDTSTSQSENQDEDNSTDVSAPVSLDGLDLYATVGGENIRLTTPYSLRPLEYHEYYLDLSGYFPNELKSVSFSNMVSMLANRYASNYNIPASSIAAYAKWNFYDEDGNYIDDSHNDDYTVIGSDTTIDLSYGSQRSGSYEIELIVGTADQLNPNNIRCRINVQVGYYYDLLEAEVYTVDSPRQPIRVYDEYFYTYDEPNRFEIPVEPDDWTEGEEAYLGLKLGSSYSSLTAKVYEGYYETEEAIASANATEITSQIMNQSNLASGGGYRTNFSWQSSWNEMPKVTLVLTRNGATACVMPVILYMYPDELYVGINNLYTQNSSSSYSSAGSLRYNDKAGFDSYATCRLYSGYKADGTYYVNLYANDPKTQSYGADAVKCAYVGNYSSTAEAEAAGQTNIKSQIFNYSTRYAVDFAQYPNGVQFTVIDNNDRVWHLGLELEERQTSTESLPPAPTPLSADTYFRMQTALTAKDGAYYKSYVMKYDDDSYYYRGYQTVFLLNQNNTPVSASQITPKFYSGGKVTVYAGHDVDGETVAAERQISEETAVDCTFGEPIQYSAAAENGRHLKNYFVTFLTQQSTPTLFVNGTNDKTNYQEDPQDPTKKIPARVVNLTRDYNYQHDIFFANLGTSALTGLKVELTGLDGTGEAENVKLDDYWTIGATNTLAGFTDTQKQSVNGTYDSYGELPNVGKIRLVPQVDEEGNMKAGKINGLLTISANGVEPVKILLTGSAGSFQINTNKLLDGVKYVSYSSLIQTNYISEGTGDAAVTFTASGLPNGITLKPNGELYGIPTTPGTYPVTITATATIDGERVTDTRTYTITIADNEDMNVWNYDQMIWNGNLDYTPVIAIPNENYDGTNFDTNVATSAGNSWDQPTMVMETMPEGDYQYFIHRVFIDSVLLTEGVDYTSEEGSIKLTIQTQTLRSFGNGKHTISAEARIGDKENGTLRRIAQNYTLNTLGTSRPNSGGSGGSGSSSSGSGSSSSRYSINVTAVTGGAAIPSRKNAIAGTKITVTLTPIAGYSPDGLAITGKNGQAVNPEKNSETEYTFLMPSGNVTVTPSFRQVETAVTPVVGAFTDVSEDNWFFEAVSYVFERGLMVGTSDSTFSPDRTVSRSMLVTVLYSLDGAPAVSSDSPFTDVQPGQWFASPVIWAMENNLISGYGDGTFGADSNLSREQAVVILYNYAKFKGYDTTQSSDLSQFDDAGSISSYAEAALQWAYASGLISGHSSTTLAPNGTATRAQLAQILKSYCETVVK